MFFGIFVINRQSGCNLQGDRWAYPVSESRCGCWFPIMITNFRIMARWKRLIIKVIGKLDHVIMFTFLGHHIGNLISFSRPTDPFLDLVLRRIILWPAIAHGAHITRNFILQRCVTFQPFNIQLSNPAISNSIATTNTPNHKAKIQKHCTEIEFSIIAVWCCFLKFSMYQVDSKVTYKIENFKFIKLWLPVCTVQVLLIRQVVSSFFFHKVLWLTC